jgi:hypothetical protein
MKSEAMSISKVPNQRPPKRKNSRKKQKNYVPDPSHAETAAKGRNSAPKRRNQKKTHA